MPEAGPALELSPLLDDDPRSIGPFQVVGRLGAGGMGAVYGAVDGSGRCIAVKVIHPRHVDRAEYRRHFAQESALVASIDAECVPEFLGADPEAEAPWLACEFVPGRTLGAHVREFGPLEGAELLLFAAGTAEGIEAIHGCGVMHRDIKPGNVILSPQGPKVVDFGIARGVDQRDREEQVAGTPGYLPPERLDGLASTTAGDVFAWGAMVAFAATGRAPYGGGTTKEILARVRAGEHELEGVPEGLRALVERALASSPEDRPSAGQCYAQVLDLLVGEVTEAPGAEPAAAAGAEAVAESEPAAPDTAAAAGGGTPAGERRLRLRQALGEGWRRFDAAGHDPRSWAAAGGLAVGLVGAVSGMAGAAAPPGAGGGGWATCAGGGGGGGGGGAGV
jgi:hypothetical protein